MTRNARPGVVKEIYNPMTNCRFEVRLVSIHGVPGEMRREEGIVWRFGITPQQAATLQLSYET